MDKPSESLSGHRPTGYSFHFGLNAVDPVHYQGWAGYLQGCENDARDMAKIARSAGLHTQLMLTAQCTRAALIQAWERAINTARAGDLLLFTYSGHGGQIPSDDHDEIDGLDETMCLYDAEWLDNETQVMLQRIPNGVRTLLIFDKCHAGTDDKLVNRGASPKAMPTQMSRRVYNAHQNFYRTIAAQIKAIVSRPLAATVLTLGASQDSQVAADGTDNGLFTASLKAAWSHGAFRGNYQDFYQTTKELMPAVQQPSFHIEGPLAQSFQNEQPFTIERNTTMINHKPTRATEFEPTIVEWGRGDPSRSVAITSPTIPSFVEGEYVASTARANRLYRYEGTQLTAVLPEDVAAAGITQRDVRFVEPLMLAAYPKRASRSRDQTYYKDSDLRAGHWMESWVWIDQGAGKLFARTITSTLTWFGGYTGGFRAMLVRADGTLIADQGFHATFGVDGTAFGSGRRDETYDWGIAPEVVAQVDRIVIWHGWEPKVNWLEEVLKWVKTIWELYEALAGDEQVSVGGDPA